MIGEGFETISFPFCKPLIQKKNDRSNVRTNCTGSGRHVCYQPDWSGEGWVKQILCKLWWGDEGQDIAEYAVMLAVILVIVVGTIRLIGSNANNVFSSVAS